MVRIGRFKTMQYLKAVTKTIIIGIQIQQINKSVAICILSPVNTPIIQFFIVSYPIQICVCKTWVGSIYCPLIQIDNPVAIAVVSIR